MAEVFQRIQALAEHPDLGRVVPESDQPFLRELVHPPLGIVYRRGPQCEGCACQAQRTPVASPPG